MIDNPLLAVRTATLVVAASNSTAKQKDQADYVCDGSNDEVEIQAAINTALYGDVFLCQGTYNLSSLTILHANLIGEGEIETQLNITGTITIHSDGHLQNLRVVVPDSYTGEAIVIDGNPPMHHHSKIYNRIVLRNPTATPSGTGLVFRAVSDAEHAEYISLNTFGDINIYGFEYGVKFESTKVTNSSFINGNVFGKFVLDKCIHMMDWTITTGGAVDGNIFQSIIMQWKADTTRGIYVDGDHNQFLSVMIFDWPTVGTCYGLEFTAASNNNFGMGFLRLLHDIGTNNTVLDINTNPISTAQWGYLGALTTQPLGADGIAGRITRESYIVIEDGTNAATLKCTVTNVWNGNTIAETDNIAKGATTGNFSLSADGKYLTIEAAGLTGNCVFALGVLWANYYTSIPLPRFRAVANDIQIIVMTGTGSTMLDITAMVDVGGIRIDFIYMTDA